MIYTRYSDVTDFMNEKGELEDLNPSAARIVAFLRSVVGWVTTRQAVISERTNDTCLRITGRARCLGDADAFLLPEEKEIHYMCPECGDNGVIQGWESIGWDRSPK